MTKYEKDLILFCSVVFILIAAFLAVVTATDAEARGALEDVSVSFTKDYPAVSIEHIEKTDVEGLYEIQAGCNILYYHPKTGNVLFGEMISKTFSNITSDRKAVLLSSVLKALPLTKAIKIGSGKNVVIEFTDIDCPFCRKLEEFFEKRSDVTRYVYLFPIEKLHPDSAKKSVAVLCSSDKPGAYREAVKGIHDSGDIPACPKDGPAALLEDHLALAGKLCVQGTPALWINGTPVAGANIPQIDQLLSSGEITQIKGKEVKP